MTGVIYVGLRNVQEHGLGSTVNTQGWKPCILYSTLP